MLTDNQALLADYARNGTEAAFRELVTRYLDLVYSTALRFVGEDRHLAQDVAQIVFTDLARKSPWLPKHVLLGGWLHRDTCFVAAKTMRSQRRRQARERHAAEMNALHEHSESNLSHLGPILDEAIDQLRDTDRTAILLRFFEQRDFRSIGEVLGTNEDTAQKRVSRALEKLHSLLQHRGVHLSAAALGTVLGSQAVTAAPPDLAVAIGGAAVASAVTGGGITATFLNIMAITKIKVALLGAVLVAGVAVPVVVHYSSTPAAPEKNLVVEQTEPGAVPMATSAIIATVSKAERQPRSSLQGLQGNPAPALSSFRPTDEIMKGQKLSAEQAQALESKLGQDPEDLSARCQLIGYYWIRQGMSKPARVQRQSHVLWFIQHNPEMKLSLYGNFDPLLDEPVYAQAKTVWLKQADDNPQNVAVLGNAAAFCLVYDHSTAEQLLKQAQALEPANPAWPERLAQLYTLDAHSAKPGEANQSAVKAFEQMQNAQANTTDEMQRFFNLNQLAQMAFDAGETDKAKTYATALLQRSAQPQQGRDYGDATYRGNLVLGRIALHNGELEAAKRYLIASARTTGSPVLNSFGPNMSLAKELLEQGEKEAVLEYFGLCANFWKNDKLTNWVQQVNQGWIPDFSANLNY